MRFDLDAFGILLRLMKMYLIHRIRANMSRNTHYFKTVRLIVMVFAMAIGCSAMAFRIRRDMPNTRKAMVNTLMAMPNIRMAMRN
ncbi:MAG TPA: hypothetical protein DCO86_00700 [Spirochaetaceae bacterium]|nr:hypothetical protein [Spirochaetaceae bacterium]